jgi:hypothetical protein
VDKHNSEEPKTTVTVEFSNRQLRLIDTLKQAYGVNTRGAVLSLLLDDLLQAEDGGSDS